MILFSETIPARPSLLDPGTAPRMHFQTTRFTSPGIRIYPFATCVCQTMMKKVRQESREKGRKPSVPTPSSIAETCTYVL